MKNIILRILQNRVSFDELIRYLYSETPPPDNNYLIYNYAPCIKKILRFGANKTAKPLFSVIIATHNRRGLLKNAFEAISHQKDVTAKNIEIVIADNGSTDETENMVINFKKNEINVVYIQLKKNYGADLARNIAVLHSQGDFLAFTDDDCVVPGDWLIEFKKELETDPEIAAVGGFKEPWPTKNRLDIYHRFLMWKHFYRPHIRTKEPNLSRNHCGLTANVCYRRKIFEKLGGFNPYFKHIGFIEFEIRAHKSGVTLLYEPRMVKHFANFSLGVHIRKTLIQGLDWYFLYLLHRDIRPNPTFLFFLRQIINDNKLILRSKSRPPLFLKSVPDIMRFSFLSIITNFCFWLGKYWLVVFGRF